MAVAMCFNKSGNLGKSTICKFGLKPRMNNATIIPIETINSHEHDDDDAKNIKGSQFGDLLSALALLPDAIVDVGSSNASSVLTMMGQYEGAHENFDYFVVPVIPRAKQIRDTISTIDALAEIGVPAQKIRVIFNMIEDTDSDLSKEFAPLFAYHKAEKLFTLNPNAVIYQQDFFAQVANTGATVESILEDETDYSALLRKAETAQERLDIAKKRSLGYLAKSVKRNLDSAIAAALE
ncbi:plasmid stabilization protein [Pseudomonas corrugata]|uniref:StbB family protein n=1 Tax=Pseudomonas corrugata TaxID=47879 RepID=UPI0018E64A0C|nr:StbB family protein [Pseudomonas corrugata]MBI6621533.1 plasmid stabilization protein [Pseudomonas corrugata]MBI6694232.1 plasmid stabilization protein [Pseudomonas corrugata]